MRPLISIIIPMKNSKAYIIGMLNSIQEQTYDNIEIVIAYDSSSTDDGLFVVKNFDSKFPIIIDENIDSSIGEARNRGLNCAHGDFVWFCDADDELFPTACEELIKPFLEDETLNVVGGGWCDCLKQNHTEIRKIYDKLLKKNSKLRREYYTLDSIDAMHNVWVKGDVNITAWAYMFRRSYLLENNIFFKDYSHGEDQIFVLETFKHTSKIGRVRSYVYFYKKHDESISRGENKALNFWIQHKEYFDDYFKLVAHEYPSVESVAYIHYLVWFLSELSMRSKEEYHEYVNKYGIKMLPLVPKGRFNHLVSSLLFNISPELYRRITKLYHKISGDI